MAKQYRLAQYGSFNITNIAKYSSRKQKNIFKKHPDFPLSETVDGSSADSNIVEAHGCCQQWWKRHNSWRAILSPAEMYQLVKPLKESTKKWRKLATKSVEIPRKCNDKIMIFPATVTMGALNVRPRTNLAPLQDLVFIGSFRQVGATKYMIYNRYWAILAGGGHKIRKLGVFVRSTTQNFGPKDDYDW